MRIQLILLGFFLITIVFIGCTTRETADNLSNQDRSHSPELSSTPFVTMIEMHVSPSVIIHHPETTETWGNLTGLSSSTLYFDYGENASFELSHGPVTIQRNDTSDSEQSYLVKTNITLKNTGLAPVEMIYMVNNLNDDVGDGCFYNFSFICGVIGFGTQNNDGYSWLDPGKSEKKPLKTIIVSPKSIEYLSSQKFLLSNVFSITVKFSDGSFDGSTGLRRQWLIDLNQTETH